MADGGWLVVIKKILTYKSTRLDAKRIYRYRMHLYQLVSVDWAIVDISDEHSTKIVILVGC
jgi:hypothetical protein